jgi:hypothetical protein
VPYTTLEELANRVDLIAPRRPITDQPIDGFGVDFNSTTLGATISFTLVNNSGIGTLVLKRNFSQDIGSAKVINTWNAQSLENNQGIVYDDTDQAIATAAEVFYWIECDPTQSDFDPVVVGPQTTSITLVQGPPNPILDFDVSRGAVSGGTVTIGVSFLPPVGDPRFDHVLIEIAGYNGITASVLIAESSVSPFSFQLEQTGETVTLTAIAVSQTGAQSTGTAPTKVITLGTSASVPAKIIGATATEIATGVQIIFPAGAETGITLYQVFRGRRGGGFAAASSIGTVTPTGSSAYVFLDTGGLGGIFEWYVFAVNATGNGAASAQILPDPASLTSADQPPNAPFNNTNFATVDSVDAGTDATIRIYGTGGVGSSWTRTTGYGNETYAAGTILHKSYTTKYWIVWDVINQLYGAQVTAPGILPDNFVFAGVVTTVASGGGGGSTGGGGAGGGTGGSGGRPLPGS